MFLYVYYNNPQAGCKALIPHYNLNSLYVVTVHSVPSNTLRDAQKSQKDAISH